MIGPIETLVVASGLAMDAFAVALGAATSPGPMAPRAAFRLPFHFGLFQALMPVAGWFMGSAVSARLAAVDHWIAFILLAFVGGHMIRDGYSRSDGETRGIDPSKGWPLVVLSLATSIDALAIGFSLAMLGLEIWAMAVTIGVVTGGLTLAGLVLGHHLGHRFGRLMEVAGGLLLFAIGMRVLMGG